jgi:hypothetical protein
MLFEKRFLGIISASLERLLELSSKPVTGYIINRFASFVLNAMPIHPRHLHSPPSYSCRSATMGNGAVKTCVISGRMTCRIAVCVNSCVGFTSFLKVHSCRLERGFDQGFAGLNKSVPGQCSGSGSNWLFWSHFLESLGNAVRASIDERA